MISSLMPIFSTNNLSLLSGERSVVIHSPEAVNVTVFSPDIPKTDSCVLSRRYRASLKELWARVTSFNRLKVSLETDKFSILQLQPSIMCRGRHLMFQSCLWGEQVTPQAG